jgi:hypothetical protein
MSKRSLPITISIVLLALAVFGLFVTYEEKSPPPQASIAETPAASPTEQLVQHLMLNTQENQNTVAENLTVPFTLTISGEKYTSNVRPQTSLYDAMQALSQQGTISFSATYYDGIGYFIDEIDGIQNGNGKYWFFYVNGESSTVGVSSYIIRPHDNIEWRFKESY